MTVALLHEPQTQPNQEMFSDFKVSPMLREFIVVDCFAVRVGHRMVCYAHSSG